MLMDFISFITYFLLCFCLQPASTHTWGGGGGPPDWSETEILLFKFIPRTNKHTHTKKIPFLELGLWVYTYGSTVSSLFLFCSALLVERDTNLGQKRRGF
ncbi:hypothetical protein V8C37DRAFT_53073 [Trichoderma ceciliae]